MLQLGKLEELEFIVTWLSLYQAVNPKFTEHSETVKLYKVLEKLEVMILPKQLKLKDSATSQLSRFIKTDL